MWTGKLLINYQKKNQHHYERSKKLKWTERTTKEHRIMSLERRIRIKEELRKADNKTELWIIKKTSFLWVNDEKDDIKSKCI